MCSYNRIVSCLKGFTVLYHIPRTYGMHIYKFPATYIFVKIYLKFKFIKNKKQEK